MSFISLEFLLFLLTAAVLYYIVPKRYQWMILLIFSYLFYISAGIKLLFFLVFTTVTTFSSALRIEQIGQTAASRESGRKRKRRVLFAGLVLNFGMLAVLKYTNFAVANLNFLFHKELAPVQWALPLGISFYIFQSMGYLIDVYWGKYKAERNVFRFALFVSFFPQILQGPIGRFDRLAHQFYEEHPFELRRVQHGLQRILWGYFKKMVLADRAGVLVNEVFTNYPQYGGVTVITAVLMYSIQLYGDFSGGMDVVIGAAEIFGITLDENFKRPYFAVSVTDFWHRWHITLGTWMKDYIFYPFSLSKGMNRFGKFTKRVFGKKTGRVLPVALANVVVFLVVGIWHGAAWKYLVYGLYNGLLIAAANLLSPLNKKALAACHINEKGRGWRLVRILRTFILVNISWYFDMAADLKAAFSMMKASVAGFSLHEITDGSLFALGLDQLDYMILAAGCLVLFIISVLQESGISIRECLDQSPLVIRWGVYLILLFSLPMFGYIMTGGGGFIYAQF